MVLFFLYASFLKNDLEFLCFQLIATDLTCHFNVVLFSTVFPQPCPHNCTCHRSPWEKVNIFDCHNKGLTRLPETVLEDTDWLLLSGNTLGSLNKAPDYLKNITLLDLSSNNITDIDETVMEIIMYNLKSLDIRKNKLRTLPKSIKKGEKTNELWISDNPYECDCDMIWIKDWLIDTTSVQDKENVTCSTSKMKGKVNSIKLITYNYFRVLFQV